MRLSYRRRGRSPAGDIAGARIAAAADDWSPVYRKAPLAQRARATLEASRLYLNSAWSGHIDRSRTADIETYCMFIGYPRSGHSLVGSFIDAHPEAVIAHELDALKYVRLGFRRNQLYSLILRNAESHAHGRVEGRYDYTVPDQWQGRFTRLRIIGDKKGGASAARLASHPELLERLRRLVRVKLRFIHVVRNPFDNIATMHRGGSAEWSFEESIARYFYRADSIRNIKGHVGAASVLDVRHEDVVSDPAAALNRICQFLDLDPSPSYLRSCSNIVFSSARRTRDGTLWTSRLVESTQARLQEYDFLKGYSF